MLLTDREEAILALRRGGLTLAEVGRRFGVTRERVRQMQARAERLERAWQACGDRLAAELRALDLVLAELAEDRLPDPDTLIPIRSNAGRKRVYYAFWRWARRRFDRDQRLALRAIIRGRRRGMGPRREQGARQLGDVRRAAERLIFAAPWLGLPVEAVGGEATADEEYAVKVYLARKGR